MSTYLNVKILAAITPIINIFGSLMNIILIIDFSSYFSKS